MQHATLDGMRVTDEVEVGVCLPSLTRKTAPALRRGNGRIGARIRIRIDRVGILVCGDIRVRGSLTAARSLTRGLPGSSTACDKNHGERGWNPTQQANAHRPTLSSLRRHV